MGCTRLTSPKPFQKQPYDLFHLSCLLRVGLPAPVQGERHSYTFQKLLISTALVNWHLLVADVHVEPHKKQLHVTLAYHFQTSHLPTLEKLAQNIDVKLGCDWVAAIFSRDIRFVNHEVNYWGLFQSPHKSTQHS